VQQRCILSLSLPTTAA